MIAVTFSSASVVSAKWQDGSNGHGIQHYLGYVLGRLAEAAIAFVQVRKSGTRRSENPAKKVQTTSFDISTTGEVAPNVVAAALMPILEIVGNRLPQDDREQLKRKNIVRDGSYFPTPGSLNSFLPR